MRSEIIALVAERKIEDAIERGLFDNLPKRGRIDCTLQGDAFLTEWWRRLLRRGAAS